MGMFNGHAWPGAFFIVFSIWWTIQLAYTRVALNGGRRPPRSRLLSTLHRLPIEGTFTVLCCIGGFIGEMMYPAPKWTLIDSEGNWKYGNVWQHVTMYTFFGFYGAVCIMARTRLPEAARFEKPFGALAFAVEGFLFFFHTHGRDDLDVQLHLLLVIAVSVCFIATASESWRPGDPLLPLIRIVFTLVQGTWFWHVGIVLYWPPSGEPWDPQDMLNVMFTTVMFTWHLAIDILVVAIVYGVTKYVLCASDHDRYSKTDYGVDQDEAETRLLGNGRNGGMSHSVIDSEYRMTCSLQNNFRSN